MQKDSTGAIFLVTKQNEQLPSSENLSQVEKQPSISSIASPSPYGFFTALNHSFLHSHHQASTMGLNDVETVLVFLNGELSLWMKRTAEFVQLDKCPISTADYHWLKTACHLPIIFLNLLTTGPIVPQMLDSLAENIKNCREAMDLMDGDKNCKVNVDKVLVHSLELMKNLQSCSQGEKEQLLEKYINKLKKPINYLSKMATEKQLYLLHQTTQQWINDHHLSLEKTRVLLIGPHGPRKGFIEMQYYERLYLSELGDDRIIKNNYVYYVEMLVKHLSTLDIREDLIHGFLAREERNKEVAGSLLGNPLGMQQDVLKPQAPQIIDELLDRSSILGS